MKKRKMSIKDIKNITRDIDTLVEWLEELHKDRMITKGGVKFLKHWYYIAFGTDLPK